MIELIFLNYPSIQKDHMKLIYIGQAATAAECRRMAENRDYGGFHWVKNNRKCYGYEEDRT